MKNLYDFLSWTKLFKHYLDEIVQALNIGMFIYN